MSDLAGHVAMFLEDTHIDEVTRASLIHMAEEDVRVDRLRTLEAIHFDWLETGPWRNFDSPETEGGDPYVRVKRIIENG